MQLKSFSSTRSPLSLRSLIAVGVAVVSFSGCATSSSVKSIAKSAAKPAAKSAPATRQLKGRDPLVRLEIAQEAFTLGTVPPALLGPINDERLVVLEAALAQETKSPSLLTGLLAQKGLASVRALESQGAQPIQLKTLRSLENSHLQLSKSSNETPFIFDFPVTYNERVSAWIRYFQTEGRRSFKTWLERSSRYVPVVQDELAKNGLPLDLVYVAMIESGFRPDAVSHAGAMGMWQFISATGRRYGLKIDWWLDERRDFSKSTQAAISYMKDLNQQFGSWYLVTASYNMGEGGVRRLVKRYGTNNFWRLADLRALPRETTDYVPKIIAATLIAKAPALYGFRDLDFHVPLAFDTVRVPGGTDLVNLAGYLGVSGKYLMELNPELTRGFIPREVRGHQIRVPKGSMLMVSQYARFQQDQSRVTAEAAN